MTLADTPARTAIRTDLAATLIVEAAAGTGKTTEMIARIIAMIRTGTTTLDRIVAVTFTEKAAGEMKLRLRTDLEGERKQTAGVERGRLELALAQLEVARIGSIHSFCADLLRERPIEARIDPLFEVAAEDESERLYLQAFDAWFQASLGTPGEGLRRILRRKEPTELLRKAGWSLVSRRDFDGAWRRDPFEREAMIDHVVAELTVLGALAARADRPDEPLAKLLAKLQRWTAELERREQVRPRDHDGLEAELAEVNRWWEWRYSGRTQRYGDGLLRADVVAQRDRVKAELETLLDAADADLAVCLREELRPVVAAYEHGKARNGELDFLDLLVRTRDLLRDDRRVREEMQQRFARFFVDEFQDTDPLQVEILMLLCATDPAESDPQRVTVAPGKLFVVGDPKQAIYRFRRADIALYELVKDRLLAQGARLLHLTTSFRSVPSIQSAVNAAFEPVMTGDGQASYVPLAKFRADLPGQPAIVALPVPNPYGKRDVSNFAIIESYPDAVGAFVEHLIVRSGWKVSERGRSAPVDVAARHVCLMFRRFQAFRQDLTRPYVRALEARGIPHVLVGGRSFHEREEVEAARNALRAIEWPDEQFSVYATLRGPFFAFHDEDLLAFKHAHDRLHPLQWTEAGAHDGITSALQILGALHVHRNRRPIADTIARLLAATRAHAGIAIWPAGEQALANLFRIQDLARRFEARGATSFRAFIERLEADADRGRQPDAPVVEEGTEGVRIMTVHAAKGLEFPVVILCDPTATLEPEHPTRFIDTARRVWLEPLANCTPTELLDHADEVIRRDREEIERLAYVAATRARDLLVVPVVGDEERSSWLQALTPVVYPVPARKREPELAMGCPPFGDDSVVTRPNFSERMPIDSVAPGQHLPRAGDHRVVWWDPSALALDKQGGGGIREQQILTADASNDAGERAHVAWQARREAALRIGATPSFAVATVADAARAAPASDTPVTIEYAAVGHAKRPHGRRFGSFVHAILAAVDLRGDLAHVRSVTENQARLLGAPAAEIEAAITAVNAALAHPLLVRAARAAQLRREVLVVLATSEGLVEGVVDLAFAEADAWTVIDFKTDVELERSREVYEAQVRLYATAIAAATECRTSATLLVV